MPTLKELRKASGKTQKELAIELGVVQQAISWWEKGERLPTLDKAVKLAKILGISLDELAQSMGIDK